MQWFYQSVAAALLLVPTWLAVGFFQKNFGLRSEVFLVWNMIGITIGVYVFDRKIFDPSIPVVAITTVVLLGLTIGTSANVLLFRAVITAPNPGLPLVLLGITNALVFVVSILLGRILPKYFEQAAFDYFHLLGIFLVSTGVALIAIKRQ